MSAQAKAEGATVGLEMVNTDDENDEVATDDNSGYSTFLFRLSMKLGKCES